jgi:hypothetical protein
MSYKILPYTLKRAKELNVDVKSSQNKGKKIDVFDKKGNKIVSIGSTSYKDYPTFKQTNPSLAEERRRLYHLRHKKDKGLAGFYAKNLLW